MDRVRLSLSIVLASAFFVIPSRADAIVDPGQLSSSPDISIAVAGLSSVVEDEDVLQEDEPNAAALGDVGSLPGNADLTGYAKLLNGDRLLSLDVTISLLGPGGPFTVEPRDIVLFDGVDYSIHFDGSANGLPTSVRIDALARVGADPVLSLNTTTSLGAVTANDEDLVRVLGGGLYELLFDGSAAGVAPQLDLDAAHVRSKHGVLFSLLLSFDIAGNVGGIRFDDEDVLEYRVVGGTWALVYDGSAEHATWSPADLDALYFPPECSDGIDNDANGQIDFPADPGCSSADDEVEFMSWTFGGIALGGTIEFTVNGVALQVTTTGGELAAKIAQLVADEINGHSTLMALNVTAAAHGDRLTTNGTVSGVVINDPGLSHNAPSVPALSAWGLVAVVSVLLGTGALWWKLAREP